MVFVSPKFHFPTTKTYLNVPNVYLTRFSNFYFPVSFDPVPFCIFSNFLVYFPDKMRYVRGPLKTRRFAVKPMKEAKTLKTSQTGTGRQISD